MAGKQEVEYTIRLRDLMSKGLKKMGLSVNKLQGQLRKGLTKGLQAARAAMKQFAIATAAVIAGGAALTAIAVRLGKSFVDAASSAEETASKFTAVFKEQTEAATEMADTIAASLGRSETEVKGFMARLQDTFVPMGLARDAAMDMSVAITSLAFDLTSFNPELGSAQEAVDALTSAMIGNHETVRKFGVIINAATLEQKLMEMGAEKVSGAFTEQDKAMARLAIIMESTTDAHGDLIRTSDSWFNSTAAITSQVQGLREEIGARLIVQLQEMIKNMGGADAVVQHIRIGFEFFAQVISKLIIPQLGNLLVNFSKFVTAIGGVDSAIWAVSKVVSLLGKVFKVMWDTVKVVLMLFGQGLDTIIWIVKSLWHSFKLLVGLIAYGLVSALKLGTKLWGLYADGLDAVVIFIKDTAIKAFQGLINILADLMEGIGFSLSGLAKFDLAPDWIGDVATAATEAAAGMREFSTELEGSKGGESFFAQVSRDLEAFEGTLTEAQTLIKGFIDESFGDLKEVTFEFVDAIVEDAPAIKEVFADIASGAVGAAMDYAVLENKVRLAMEQLKEVELTTPEQVDQAALLTEHLERLQQGLKGAAKEGRTFADVGADMMGAAEGFVGKLFEAKEGVSGIGETMDVVGARMTDWAENTVPDMNQALGDIAVAATEQFAAGMTQAFMSVIDGSKSAGEAFRDFAKSFVSSVMEMIIQTLILKAIRTAILGGGGVVEGGMGEPTELAMGGVVSGGLGRFVPVKGYATGGPIVNKPHVAVIGEGQYNEAVVPLPDGRSIPVDMNGSAGAEVNINIEAVDGSSVDQLLFDRKDTLRSIISAAIAESRSFRTQVAKA